MYDKIGQMGQKNVLWISFKSTIPHFHPQYSTTYFNIITLSFIDWFRDQFVIYFLCHQSKTWHNTKSDNQSFLLVLLGYFLIGICKRVTFHPPIFPFLFRSSNTSRSYFLLRNSWSTPVSVGTFYPIEDIKAIANRQPTKTING